MKPQELLKEISVQTTCNQEVSRCQMRAMHLEGGFEFRKFTSNNVDVLKIIPNDLRKDGTKNKDLKLGHFTDDKTLGVKQNVKDDTLGFILNMDDKRAAQ